MVSGEPKRFIQEGPTSTFAAGSMNKRLPERVSVGSLRVERVGLVLLRMLPVIGAHPLKRPWLSAIGKGGPM
jgi:hypothetical protein